MPRAKSIVNEFQLGLLESYPLDSIDPTDPAGVDRAVQNEMTGDTLFDFLWRELGVAQNAVDARERMDSLIGQMQEVREAMCSIENRAFQEMAGRAPLAPALAEDSPSP